MVGKTISHFRIVEKLGEGGMGVVYRAEDTKLHRRVALKFIRPDAVENREVTARFLTEAEAAAALTHPNICIVYEVDQADGQAFLAMEYVEGESLAERIARRPLPLDDGLGIVVQVAEGLQAAHEGGVVHRDVKPANIMVGDDGRVKVMDFGLARLDEATRITKTGATLGTPAYMSPEQVRGEKVDHRTDIWSLGVVLYEAVTGRLPFRGDVREAVSHAIIHEEPEPLTALRTGVPVDLDRVVSRALAKLPGERYQHVDEFLVDLRLLSRKAPAGSSSTAVAKPSRRRNVLVALCVLFIGALLAALGLHLTSTRTGGAPGQLSIAVLPLRNLANDPDQEYLSDGLTEQLIGDLARFKDVRIVSRTSAMQYKGANKSLPEIARELKVDHIVEGSALRAGDRVRITAQLIDARTDLHLWAGSYERDLRDVLALQSELARAIAREIKATLSPEESQRLAETREVNPEAYEAYLKGKSHWHKWTIPDVERSVEYFRAAIETDPSYAPAHAWLATGLRFLAMLGAAPGMVLMQEAEEAATRAVELDDALIDGYSSLAACKAYAWDWEASERAFRRALELNPGNADAHHRYGILCLAPTGRLGEAMREMETTLELDPLSAIAYSMFAYIHRFDGDPDKAIRRAREALALDPQFSMAFRQLGSAYQEKGLHEQAVAAFEQAQELSPSSEHRALLAHAYAQSGEPDKARRLLEELVENSRGSYVSPRALAIAHLGMGENDKAMAALEKSLAQQEPGLIFLNVDPIFEPLHADPRFGALVKRMNLQ